MQSSCTVWRLLYESHPHHSLCSLDLNQIHLLCSHSLFSTFSSPTKHCVHQSFSWKIIKSALNYQPVFWRATPCFDWTKAESWLSAEDSSSLDTFSSKVAHFLIPHVPLGWKVGSTHLSYSFFQIFASLANIYKIPLYTCRCEKERKGRDSTALGKGWSTTDLLNYCFESWETSVTS